MTELKAMKNDKLLLNLKSLLQDEKKLIREILEYLEEVETRKLFLEMGFSSLFSFCTGYLDYSHQEAQIRIQAMRLGKVLPEVKDQIQRGELSLSAAAKVQSHVGREQKLRKEEKQKPMAVAEKKQVLESVKNQSVRKAEEILLSIFPHHFEEKPEKVKATGPNTMRVEMNLSKETFELLMKVKALRSHVSLDFEGLIRDFCQMALKKHDPEMKKPRTTLGLDQQPMTKPEKLETSDSLNSHTNILSQGLESGKAHRSQKPLFTSSTTSRKNISRYISSPQKHYVWMRDKGRCSFKDHRTGRKCHSNYRIQYDHIQPLAFGGKTSVENLRLLCFSHHQLMTNKSFPHGQGGAKVVDRRP